MLYLVCSLFLLYKNVFYNMQWIHAVYLKAAFSSLESETLCLLSAALLCAVKTHTCGTQSERTVSQF